MQINQHNYETFFLMYADNELTQQQKKMVDAFISQHPGLKAELDLLLRTVLHNDRELRFPGKGKLMKNAPVAEEELLTYLDGEADAELIEKIRTALADNKNLQQEMAVLERTVVKPDEKVVYPGKQALYRSVPVRKMDWWKPAVAASVLLLLSTWLFLYKDDDNTADKVAVTDTVMQHSPAETHTVAPPAAVITDGVKSPGSDAVLFPIKKNEAPAAVETGARSAGKSRTAQPQVQAVAMNDQTEPAITEANKAPEEAAKHTAVNAAPPTVNNDNKFRKSEPETVFIPPVAEPVASADAEEKEKKSSFFKKIGRKIGDRALDILTDGGQDINVAGFAINVRK